MLDGIRIVGETWQNWAGNIIITKVFFLSPHTVKFARPAQVTKLYMYIYSSAIICHKEPMGIFAWSSLVPLSLWQKGCWLPCMIRIYLALYGLTNIIIKNGFLSSPLSTHSKIGQVKTGGHTTELRDWEEILRKEIVENIFISTLT